MLILCFRYKLFSPSRILTPTIKVRQKPTLVRKKASLFMGSFILWHALSRASFCSDNTS